ncbi:MAG: ABC transporter permease subunit, partial [Geminicoccaceae bacterium]
MELFNTEVAVRSLGPLLAGLSITVLLTVIVIILALILGLAVALVRLYGPRWAAWLVAAYVEGIRGTPLLLQLSYIFDVLPEIGIRLDAVTAAFSGLTL